MSRVVIRKKGKDNLAQAIDVAREDGYKEGYSRGLRDAENLTRISMDEKNAELFALDVKHMQLQKEVESLNGIIETNSGVYTKALSKLTNQLQITGKHNRDLTERLETANKKLTKFRQASSNVVSKSLRRRNRRSFITGQDNDYYGDKG